MFCETKRLSLLEAARAAGCSTEAVRRWCADLGIGVLEDKKWRVDPAKLDQIIAARSALKKGRV